MKDTQSKTFQYIKIENEGNRYFCVQQNLGLVAWILFFQKDTLRPIIRNGINTFSVRLVLRRLRRRYRLLRKNVILLIIFTLHKYQLRKIDSVVTLPVYGQICTSVHKGYKIFDPRKGVVTKIFDHDVHPLDIQNEIERLKKVSPIDFAPSLKRWNFEERWYEEDYVSGSLDSSYTPMDSQALLEKFQHEVVPCMNSLVGFQQPTCKNSVEYANEIIQTIEANRLLTQGGTTEEFTQIEKFLDHTAKALQAEETCLVYLVLTHGDFCPANMLNTRQGMKIIDWESAGCRSALFDFYSYFFYRSVSRTIPVTTLVSEINETLPLFVSSLAKKSPEIAHSVESLSEIYRWLYYIERICMLVERKKTDKNLNILAGIVRYIEACSRYEEIRACHKQERERVE